MFYQVNDDMSQNSMLSKQYNSKFASRGDGKHCDCDCAGHAPEMHVKAATMLEQVGEVLHVFIRK